MLKIRLVLEHAVWKFCTFTTNKEMWQILKHLRSLTDIELNQRPVKFEQFYCASNLYPRINHAESAYENGSKNTHIR